LPYQGHQWFPQSQMQWPILICHLILLWEVLSMLHFMLGKNQSPYQDLLGFILFRCLLSHKYHLSLPIHFSSMLQGSHTHSSNLQNCFHFRVLQSLFTRKVILPGIYITSSLLVFRSLL
jgi:hypothetical protein